MKYHIIWELLKEYLVPNMGTLIIWAVVFSIVGFVFGIIFVRFLNKKKIF
jgi:hypothetical protein